MEQPTATPERSTTAIVVVATEYRFEPATVRVRVNEQAGVSLRNEGEEAHNWTVEGLGLPISPGAAAGMQATVFFRPSVTGTFRIVCTEADHEELGQVGQLIVE